MVRPLWMWGCVLAAWSAAAGETLHFPADRPVDMRHIALDLTVDLAAQHVDASATLEMVALREVSAIELDAVGFDVSAVRQTRGQGAWQDAEFANTGKTILLTLSSPLPRDEAVRVQIDYALQDPESGLHFYAPSDEEPDVPYLMWSQGQSIYNRHWVPCFDHPNEMQTTEMRVTVARPYEAISNGRLVETVEADDGMRTYHWRQDKPHVSYLMTLVVGEFVSKTETWRGIPVSYYVREKYADTIDATFANTAEMLETFSRTFGYAYPWAKYAQVCCYGFGGGMENTSSTTLGEGCLFDESAAVDEDCDGLIAHELGHQWFGDLLTCSDWAHLWLNEGFASYCEVFWDEHHNGADAAAYNLYRKAESARSGGRDKPVVDRGYDNPGEQFDSRAYPKGAWILHMVRRRLGDDAFWRVIGEHCRRFAHRSVETSDFRKVIEDVSGRAMGRFFHDWTERPGHPEVTVTFDWDAEESIAWVDIHQTQKAEPFHFPLRIEFHSGGDTSPVVVEKMITARRQKAFAHLPRRPDLLRIDPQQAVLMALKREQPRDLWVAQLERDPSVVARVEAAKYFGASDEAADRTLLAGRLAAEPFWAVQRHIATALGEAGDDVARDALLAARSMAHPKARVAVAEALGKFHGDAEVIDVLAGWLDDGDASDRVLAAAISAYVEVADAPLPAIDRFLEHESHRERVRSAVLEAIGAHGTERDVDRLVAWSRPGRPAACRVAAVRALGALLDDEALDDAHVERGVAAMMALLESGSRRTQVSVLRALQGLGERGATALEAIDELAAHGSNRIRTLARETARKIRADRATPAYKEALLEQIDQLREEFERLREQVEKHAGAPAV